MPREKSKQPHRSRSASRRRRASKRRKATQSMSMTELQFRARSLGIPFGGLRKTQLINKINTYT